ncbi:hypothetical protein GZ998_05550 [Actinomyces sp. 594]|uniref:hypothetical protein n=1 Tax=Actinomyces sp. 594 TaxID=2057793 RepID=UPI001C57893B|nr:hypothetical protein [Actinomyces sp. 594]MBW3068978.1 hypothetical protein [Actinomyces sp. 594]
MKRKRVSSLFSVLGRRDAFKYLSIAVAGAVVAPLTGCSGSTLAFSKFAAGTWTVTVPTDQYNPPPITIAITQDGTWSSQIIAETYTSTSSGTWRLSGGSLIVDEDKAPDDYSALIRGLTGTAQSIPKDVDTEDMITSFQWICDDGDTDISVRLVWDRENKTMTFFPSNDYEPIVATKTD